MRLDFPALKRKVIEVYERWARWQKPILLIEDAGSGTNLIQELYDRDIPSIGIRPEGDKMMRMSAQTAKIEAGALHLPHNAPWLDDLKSELLAFPLGLHDDQVDSTSQALNWMSRPRPRPSRIGNTGPLGTVRRLSPHHCRSGRRRNGGNGAWNEVRRELRLLDFSAQPHRDDIDRGSEACIGFFVARRYASKGFEGTEEVFDEVAPLVLFCVVWRVSGGPSSL
jgi:predicted phage terminase large subunit-like protein